MKSQMLAALIAASLALAPAAQAKLSKAEAAMDRVARHLPSSDEEERAAMAELDAEIPLKDLDAAVEDLLLARCEEWGRTQAFTLLAEGLHDQYSAMWS